MHKPVLLEQVLQAFEDIDLKTFCDGTLGAGGHAEALLSSHKELVRFFGFDQDASARELAKQRLAPWGSKVTIIPTNFSQLKEQLNRYSASSFDGILLDIGVSSMQIDQGERGFSFGKEGPLDMRMDTTQELTASEVVNEWPQEKLAKIFRDFGEEKRWRRASQLICERRALKPFSTTKELAEFLYPHLKGGKKFQTIHPATLIFQAIRIAVNRELEVLEAVLPQAISLLRPGGILAVITFHSLEDRIVKNYLRFLASDKYDTSGLGGVFLDKKPEVALVTRKPMIASAEEIQCNPRSRSAKLRIAKKL